MDMLHGLQPSRLIHKTFHISHETAVWPAFNQHTNLEALSTSGPHENSTISFILFFSFFVFNLQFILSDSLVSFNIPQGAPKMHKKNSRLLISLFLFGPTMWIIAGCVEEPLENIITRSESPLVCSGQQDKQITTATVDYIGSMEDVFYSTQAEDVRHGADAEVLWHSGTTPSDEKFAVAWVGGELGQHKVYVRGYDSDPAVKNFLPWSPAIKVLDDAPSSGWVRRMGFDDVCTATYFYGAGHCAWFVWQPETPWVKYRAINKEGSMSKTWVLAMGWQPSGERGQKVIQTPWSTYILRNTLVAWISVDRKQIKIARLDPNGNKISGSEAVLADTDNLFYAFQTAVAWSGKEDRWLVAWTEQDNSQDLSWNGKVYTKYVDFNGQPGPQKNLVTYCEGDLDDPGCNFQPGPEAGVKSISEPEAGVKFMPGTKENSKCICKGIWLASSYYSSTSDRYRLQQYGKHSRLNLAGVRQGNPASIIGGVWSPIAEAHFYHGGKLHPFQNMYNPSGSSSENRHLEMESENFVEQGVAINDFLYPQALRSAGDVAIAVSTNNNNELRLSILDVHYGGCPTPKAVIKK